MTLYTDICKLIRQVAPPALPAVAFASKLILFLICEVFPWPLTFRSQNGFTSQPCLTLPSC